MPSIEDHTGVEGFYRTLDTEGTHDDPRPKYVQFLQDRLGYTGSLDIAKIQRDGRNPDRGLLGVEVALGHRLPQFLGLVGMEAYALRIATAEPVTTGQAQENMSRQLGELDAHLKQRWHDLSIRRTHSPQTVMQVARDVATPLSEQLIQATRTDALHQLIDAAPHPEQINLASQALDLGKIALVMGILEEFAPVVLHNHPLDRDPAMTAEALEDEAKVYWGGQIDSIYTGTMELAFDLIHPPTPDTMGWIRNGIFDVEIDGTPAVAANIHAGHKYLDTATEIEDAIDGTTTTAAVAMDGLTYFASRKFHRTGRVNNVGVHEIPEGVWGMLEVAARTPK